MSKPAWLVYNGYGDAVICKTYKQAETEAGDIDAYRSFFFSDSPRKYICLIVKCLSVQAAKHKLECMIKMRADRSNVSYF